MEGLNLEYYYGIESEEFAFIKFPRLLIKDKRYRALDSDAKILYGLMLDRMSLSQKNDWYDDKGRAYIYYTLDEAQEDLGRGREKTVKVMDELEKIGLIERRRQGQGKPSAIYVKKFTTDPLKNTKKNGGNTSGKRVSQKSENRTSRSSKTELQGVGKPNFKKSEKPTSRSSESGLQEVRESNCNYTDMSYTEMSNTYQSFTHTEEETGKTEDVNDVIDMTDPLVKQKQYTELIRSNVNYAALVLEYPDDVERIDELIRVMVNVICFGQGEYNINRCKVPAKVIASQFCKLDREHMVYALSSLKKANTKLTAPEAYMVATLYTARNTSLNDTMQQFNYDTRGHSRDEPQKREKKDDFDWELLVNNG